MNLLPLILLTLAAPQQSGSLDIPLRGEGRARSGALEDSKQRLALSLLEFERQASVHDVSRAWQFGIEPPTEGLTEGFALWKRLLRQQSNQLDNLWTPDLNEHERGQRDSLRDRVQTESILASALPRQRWDPVYYIEYAELLLEAAEAGDAEYRAEALQAIDSLLGETTERLLVNPRSGWIEEAIVRLLGVKLKLAALPDSEAAQATCDGFRDWLQDATTRYGDPIPRLGLRNWEALVQACSGTALDTSEIRIRLLREIGRLDTLLRDYAGPQAPEGDLESVTSRAEAYTRFARNEGRRGNVIPSIPHVVTVKAVKGGAYPPLPVRAFQTDGETRVQVTAPNDYWPEGLRRAYARELDPNVVSTMAIRYGMPGEGHLSGATRKSGSVSPMLWNRSTVEAWGIYSLDWLSRHPESAPAFLKQKKLSAEMVRAQLIEAAKFLATLEWHTQSLAEGVIAQQFANRTGLDIAVTQLEVRRSTHDPLYGIGALGAVELRDLEWLLRRRLNPPDAIKMVADLILTRPDLRPSDVIAHGPLNGSG